MSYLDQSEIASNGSMFSRVAQCAASEDIPDPDNWTQINRRQWAASPGWDAAWASAKASHPPVNGEPIYDPGADEAVITDAQILSEVQSLNATPPGQT